jgi:hypothetical protein
MVRLMTMLALKKLIIAGPLVAFSSDRAVPRRSGRSSLSAILAGEMSESGHSRRFDDGRHTSGDPLTSVKPVPPIVRDAPQGDMAASIA